MNATISSGDFLMVAVLVFVAMVLLLEGVYLLWRSRSGSGLRRLERRLDTLNGRRGDGAQGALLKQRQLSELPVLERMLASAPKMPQLERFLIQSGVGWSVSRLVLLTLALFSLGALGAAAAANASFFAALLYGGAAGALPGLYVRVRQKRRLRQLANQLPEVLDFLGRSLRAGHALAAALKMAGEEMAEPMASEFSAVHDEITFGVSLEQAMTHLAERVPLPDMRYFVIAVLVQRQSGGNLTEILGNLSRLIRERIKLMNKVRVLAADGNMSAWIMGLMPFALAGLLYLMNPEFISRMWTDPLGITMTKTLLVMMVIGMVVLRRIVKIRV